MNTYCRAGTVPSMMPTRHHCMPRTTPEWRTIIMLILQMRWLTQHDARGLIRLPPGTCSPPLRCGHTASWPPCLPRSWGSSHVLSEPSAALSAPQQCKLWSSPGRGLPALLGPRGLCDSRKDPREEASEKTAVRGSRKQWKLGSQ